MTLPLYISLSWYVTALAITARRKMPKQEWAFLILFLIIVNTHIFNLFDDSFRWISISKNRVLFTCYSLYRSVIVPMGLTYFADRFYGKRIVAGIILGAAVMALLDALSAYLRLFHYANWHFIYSGIYFSLIQTGGLIALCGFRKWCGHTYADKVR